MTGPMLCLLGPFALEPPAPARGASLGRKGEALVTFVALQGASGAARPQLMARLWPDLAGEDARNALRQCLHQVRRTGAGMAAALNADGDRIVLHGDACTVDVWRFQSLVRRDDLASMLEAADLYRGDLAEGLDAGSEFESWLAPERERLREAAQRLLARLSEHPDVAGRQHADSAAAFARTADLARRMLAADPVHEGAWCALIRLHSRAGLHAKASQAWGECRRTLWRELQVEPSAQTAATVQRLLAPANGETRAAATLAALAPGAFDTAGGDTGVLDHMLHGWQCFSDFSAAGNREARSAFEAAVAAAPGHAEALALIGFTHLFDSIHGWTDDPTLSLRDADACAEQAMSCNPAEPRGLQLMAKLHLWRHQHDPALELLRQALMLAPASAYAHFHLAEGEMWCGRGAEALAHLDRAIRLDANDHGVFLAVRAFSQWLTGDLAGARVTALRAATRNPDYAWSHATLAAVLAEQGKLEAARDAAATARRFNRRLSGSFADGVLPLRQAEHRERLRQAWLQAGMPEEETDCVPVRPR